MRCSPQGGILVLGIGGGRPEQVAVIYVRSDWDCGYDPLNLEMRLGKLDLGG